MWIAAILGCLLERQLSETMVLCCWGEVTWNFGIKWVEKGQISTASRSESLPLWLWNTSHLWKLWCFKGKTFVRALSPLLELWLRTNAQHVKQSLPLPVKEPLKLNAQHLDIDSVMYVSWLCVTFMEADHRIYSFLTQMMISACTVLRLLKWVCNY